MGEQEPEFQGKKNRHGFREILRDSVIITAVLLIGSAAAAAGISGTSLPADFEQSFRRALQEAGFAETETDTETGTETETERMKEEAVAALEEAAGLAVMYDYDGAAACLKDNEYYDRYPELQQAAESYAAQKEACVSWEPETVTHVFFHTILVDPSRAFDGEGDQDGFNQYMVTMDEFSKIMNTMYEEGYVMVSLHDMCEVHEDGSMTPKTIELPEGKIPFVLSQDDVSYYHYMDGDGFAQKLVLDENGEVKNTYVDAEGNVLTGDYDLVPWIDTFVKEHPDFSYHGRKGIIALTGYEGVLGYRTDEVYRTREAERVTEWQQQFFNENPDFDDAAWQKEVDDATAVADAMKAEGWEFASHTWGHIDPIAKELEGLITDTERWMANVEPIVGPTDVIIFAFGADISDWQPYTDENEYYVYLKSQGFDIFCNVDSAQYDVQFNGESLRMGRRNIDGYRMYYFPELLTDLFDVDDVWDSSRPVPVAAIS